MKALLIALSLFISPGESKQAPPVKDCRCNGKILAGKVFTAESKYDNVDFIVFIDNDHPDLRVTKVPLYSFFECGQWHFTDMRGSADFTVFFTDNRYEADFVIEIKE
jgi:hypothetical protein